MSSLLLWTGITLYCLVGFCFVSILYVAHEDKLTQMVKRLRESDRQVPTQLMLYCWVMLAFHLIVFILWPVVAFSLCCSVEETLTILGIDVD